MKDVVGFVDELKKLCQPKLLHPNSMTPPAEPIEISKSIQQLYNFHKIILLIRRLLKPTVVSQETLQACLSANYSSDHIIHDQLASFYRSRSDNKDQALGNIITTISHDYLTLLKNMIGTLTSDATRGDNNNYIYVITLYSVFHITHKLNQDIATRSGTKTNLALFNDVFTRLCALFPPHTDEAKLALCLLKMHYHLYASIHLNNQLKQLPLPAYDVSWGLSPLFECDPHAQQRGELADEITQNLDAADSLVEICEQHFTSCKKTALLSHQLHQAGVFNSNDTHIEFQKLCKTLDNYKKKCGLNQDQVHYTL